jgi:hypothetical protein
LRELFPGYYRPTEEEFAKLWSDATFVFDTNILLDFYSYPEDLRKVYLSVLSKLEDRIWIPYQVGLEFHINRFSRIKQEHKRVVDLLKTIKDTGAKISQEVKSIELEKRNIGIDDIDARLNSIQTAHIALTEAVQRACDKLPPISLDDPIGDEICKLFEGRVGPAPFDQAALELLLKNAQTRFDNEIPPGFLDQKRKSDELFFDRGLTYQKKFGDLILWLQTINYSRENNINSIVFVTGDGKKDWWWEVDGKTLGPLPMIVQEIAGAGVKPFWMYSPDQFLENAEKYLKATGVTPEAVKQVKELSDQSSESKILSEENPVISRLSVIEAMERMSLLMQSPKYKDENFNALSKLVYDRRQLHPAALDIAKYPAVSVEQDADPNTTQNYNRGIIRINILRDTVIATGSGKLKPAMNGIPFISATLEKMPEGSYDLVKYTTGTGTNFDFNINMKSPNYSVPLPIGEYVFSYEAKCDSGS